MTIWGTSLVVQCLRLRASTAEGAGLIPGWETKIPLKPLSEANKKQTKKYI